MIDWVVKDRANNVCYRIGEEKDNKEIEEKNQTKFLLCLCSFQEMPPSIHHFCLCLFQKNASLYPPSLLSGITNMTNTLKLQQRRHITHYTKTKTWSAPTHTKDGLRGEEAELTGKTLIFTKITR